MSIFTFWYLVVIAIGDDGLAYAETSQSYQTMAECFDAREKGLAQVGLLDPNDRITQGVQAVCVGKSEQSF